MTASDINNIFICHLKLHTIQYCFSFISSEIGECFENLSTDGDCRVIVLTGSGKLFTAGIDLNDMMSLGQELGEVEDIARKAKILQVLIRKYQNSLSSLEVCNKPVIAAVHGPCVGAGVDMITAADIRYCTKDAWFQVKEVLTFIFKYGLPDFIIVQ